MKFPGSNWWAFDFHNHTPASSDYKTTERGSLTPREWLLAYMQAGIECVAVTDHNCGDWIERLKQELASMSTAQPPNPDYRHLHIFPGVEVTTSEGLHVLAIYDPNEGAAKIHGLLARAKCNNISNNAESICQEGAVAICDHIHQTGGVVILAHGEEINGIFEGSIDSATGRFNSRRGSREIDQILERCDGIEVHNLNHPAVQHFAGRIANRAVVDGSDAHKTGAAGTRSVWIKMAAPSIEGLKLALLDPECSILRQPNTPAAPPNRITSLKIEQLHLRRQPLEVNFSPWFNSVIGGRGSGKSTLLEALRLVMARESDIEQLGDDSDVRRTFSRFRQVGGARGNVGMVRQDTFLEATVEKFDGSSNSSEHYMLIWTPNEFKAKRRDETGNWEDTGLSAKQTSNLFPVKVFSQKQIFELAERPSALLTYIDRASEVDFQSWHEKNEVLRRELRELRNKERVLLQAIEKKAQLGAELKEVSRKTTAYQQSNVAQQVKVFRENQQARQTVVSFTDALAIPLRTLEEVIGQTNPFGGVKFGHIALKNPDPAPVQQAASSLLTDLAVQYDLVRQAIEGLRQKIEAFSAASEVTAFLKEMDIAMAAYRQEVEKLKSEGVGTALEAEAALKRKQELETELAQIATQEIQLTEIQKAILRSYATLKFHRRKLTRLRQEFVQSVLAQNPNLRICVQGQEDVHQSLSHFRSILRLQDNTFMEEVLSDDEISGQPTGLLGRLVSSDIYDPTHKRVTNLKLGILERSGTVLGQAVHGKLVTALKRLGSDDDDALLEWFPDDRVTVEFKRADSTNYQSLERASAGQKTSAILSFLLAHGDEPLLLDQPEDDLDNALISELVVQQIRGNKSRRQIIVVTHNPNIVVNGDAELVLPMSFVGGQIQLNDAGGLQVRAVRQQICDVMEGGRDAFRQRYKRILEDLDASR